MSWVIVIPKEWHRVFKKKKNLKSRCHTKGRVGAATRTRPSFGMTTSQAIYRDLFAWCCPHYTMSKSFHSTLWALFMWVVRLLFCVKDWKQRSQENGRSPEWILSWLFKFTFCENDCWQTEQENGFCPVWILVCLSRFCFCEKVLLQTEHENTSPPWWVFMCLFMLVK